MKTDTLGTWRNPPLAYVVAEIVISPYYSMNNAVPSLQDKLRKAYPRTMEGQEIVVDANKTTAQPVWSLLSASQEHGVQLGTRAIALHATSYIDSNDFLRRWADILDAIGTAKLDAFVERAGLRYIDLIAPSSNSSPADYLAEQLKGITPEGAISLGSMWAAGFQFDGSAVNMRAAAPAPKGVILPPDFNALPLHKPQVMREAELRLRDDIPIGFIDTDCIKEVKHVFDASALMGVYADMQKLTSRVFKAVLSSKAKGEWI